MNRNLLALMSAITLSITAASAAERFEPYNVVHPGEVTLGFLLGSWICTDPGVRLIESWSADRGGIIGMRRRVKEGTNSKSDVYDFFAVEGGGMKMRRMNIYLRDIGSESESSGQVGYHADCTNKLTITFCPRTSPTVPSITMRYESPKDEELVLEIETNENGSTTKETYHLHRMPLNSLTASTPQQ